MKSSLCFLALAGPALSFAPVPLHTPTTPTITTTTTTTTTLFEKENNNNAFSNWARASRSADVEDKVVELNRPLGLILNADQDGNVYVETVAPRSNAARNGQIKEGDVITMCSATFGTWMLFFFVLLLSVSGT